MPSPSRLLGSLVCPGSFVTISVVFGDSQSGFSIQASLLGSVLVLVPTGRLPHKPPGESSCSLSLLPSCVTLSVSHSDRYLGSSSIPSPPSPPTSSQSIARVPVSPVCSCLSHPHCHYAVTGNLSWPPCLQPLP